MVDSRKTILIIGIIGLYLLLAYATNPTIIVFSDPSDSCLADCLILDFSQTQFSFIDPMENWLVFKFKATNIGDKNLLIVCSQYCVESPERTPTRAPQGDTPLAPGESMWFKMILGGENCNYDPNIPQTINRTLHMEFVDRNNNWPYPNERFSLNKTIQITVVNPTSLEGDVVIEGITVDEDGTPIPNVGIDLGGYGSKVPISSDSTGHFFYSIAESPVYFLVAKKEGYRTTFVNINRTDAEKFHTVTLFREASPTSVSAYSINKITGNIGFWRCAATADESKLLLVNGMENWEDESIKNQSKLYLLDTNTGRILWTHDMGWESWSADITDDGRYVVFGTKLEGFQTGPEGFVNYIRLLNGTNGLTIWEKKITTQNFPASTQGESYTRGVKFSHSGNYIFVPVEPEYGYLLNRSDGSIVWYKWLSQNIREVIFTKDDQYVYIPSGSGWLYKLRVVDGSEVWKQWIGCWAYVNGFDISSDEKHIAVATKAAYLTVVNTIDGAIRFTTDIHSGSATCRFSPDGTKIAACGDLLTMFDLDGNVLWRDYSGAGDIRFSSDGRLIFTTNGGVLDSNGTVLYDILPGWDRSTKIGWINSNATRYIFAIQDTRTVEKINIIEVYRIETSTNTLPDVISPLIGAPFRNPPQENVQINQPVTVSVNVTDTQTGVREVILSYRRDQSSAWTNTTMNSVNGDMYVGQIPGFPEKTQVQYKIIAYDNAGNFAVNDKAGQYYVYADSSEFPLVPLLATLMIFTIVAVALAKKKTRKHET